ncbi:MAG: AEC family transporter [Clostridia bacterium]|nr:AEC family transporter [Clostridia bacterium]
MSGFLTMARLQLLLMIYLLVGVYARKRNIITKDVRQGLVDFLVRVTLPCMVFESFHQEITAQQLVSMGKLLAVSFGVCFFSVFLGKLLFYSRPAARRGVLQYGTLISNSGFAGLPVVQHAYGSLGLLYGAIFVIPNRIFMWSAGISMFTQADLKTKVKSVLTNPGIIVVELGVARMLLRIPLPSLLDDAIGSIGSCTTVLAMVVVGAILADIPLKALFDKDVFILTVVRLIGIPVLLLVFMRLVGSEQVSTAVGVTMTAMPVGSTSALLAEKYGGDSELGSKCVFVSTVLSMITVPVLAIFL